MNKGSNPLVIFLVDALLTPAHLPLGNNIRLAAFGWRDAPSERGGWHPCRQSVSA